jgi:photosystem I subunit III
MALSAKFQLNGQQLKTRAQRKQAARAAPVVASAEGVRSAAGKLATSLALVGALTLGEAANAKEVAPYAGLVPCATSAAFAKREKNEVKSLTKRLKNVRAQPARAARLQPRLVQKNPSAAYLLSAALRCRLRASVQPAAVSSLCSPA